MEPETAPSHGRLLPERHRHERRRRGRRRRIGAWAASIGFHILLFYLCFASLKGAAVSGGGGIDDGVPQAYWISLAGLQGGEPQAQTNPSQAELDAIFQRVRDQQSPEVATPDKPAARASLDKLFDVIDQQRTAREPKPAPASQGQGEGSRDLGGSGAASQGDKSQHPQKQGQAQAPKNVVGPGNGASTGSGLWGQIAPCWGRLPQVSTVPVTLEVTLNGRGLIATPPKIVRPDARPPDEQRLISEARALAALTACVPYHVDGMGPKGQTVTVNFAKR